MPLFYFDIADGQFHKDEEGRDLPDRSYVEDELRRRLSEIVLQGDTPTSALIKVRDEQGIVATAMVSATIGYPDTHH